VQQDPAKSAELLAIMQRQLRQMTRLIDDLLDLARITQGRILLRRDRTSVEAVVASAVEAVQPLIYERQHQLTVTLPDEELWLDADAARLAQILTNLLLNAAKYTNPHGRIDLIVERNQDDILFRVRDNGPGISPEMLTKIFDLFMQVEQTLNRAHGGLGIGLALVRKLVELHGGRVTAFSDGPGRGSEFVVRLPLPNEALSSATSSTTALPESPQPLPTLRVLVVDDVQASAKTLVLMLRALDQDAEAVFDGRTAITRMTQEHFDVVFLDIAMPGMDGLEVAREVRTHTELDSVTLVALTGFGQEEDRRSSLEAGFDEHLVKPTSLDLLREMLQHAASGGTM
jgi:two-component system CheB/CheR fusion protein